MSKIGRILRPREDKPDHLRQTEDSRDEPGDHAHYEGDSARVLEDCGVETFGQAAENVSDVVKIGDDGADRHHVAKDVTEI